MRPALRLRSGGFTLMEIMIVAAIVALLAGIGVPIYRSALESARVAKAVVELKQMAQEIDIYRLRNGILPDSLADLGRRVKDDPWGRPYIYIRLDDLPSRGGAAGGGAGSGLALPEAGKGTILEARKDEIRQAVTTAVARARVESVLASNEEASSSSSEVLDADDLQELLAVGLEEIRESLIRRDSNLFPLNSDFDLYSLGPDGKTCSRISIGAGLDDVIRANDGLYYGLASEY